MKKKYLPKKQKPLDLVRGAYDKDGQWWYENDIQTFTGGMITLCFGKPREKIKIVEIERKTLLSKPCKTNTKRS
jgi:hypothetical protein